MPRPMFLFDVDNTLLDNDRVKRHMEERTREMLGEHAHRFWQIYEEVRDECDFVDFPRTLERYAGEFPAEPKFPELAGQLLCYPYQDYLFPGALAAIAHVKAVGEVAIVSDGDLVFQPAKIGRSGLAAAVDHRVLIFRHKDQEFDLVEERLAAERYVVVDDKPSILDNLKQRLADRVFTVHVRQGKYAEDAPRLAADLELRSIGDLAEVELARFTTDRNQ